MHDRLRLTQAKMPDEVQLELLAPWYTQNTSESRTLDFFDAIPKYPFSVTTTIPTVLYWIKTTVSSMPASPKSIADQKSSLFRFTVCGFELICAT